MAGLIAQRPHDDAGVVLVAFDGPLHAVQECRLPPDVVARVAPPLVEHKAMRLVVAFVDDIEAVLVAEVQEARVRRVVVSPPALSFPLFRRGCSADHASMSGSRCGPAAGTCWRPSSGMVSNAV